MKKIKPEKVFKHANNFTSWSFDQYHPATSVVILTDKGAVTATDKFKMLLVDNVFKPEDMGFTERKMMITNPYSHLWRQSSDGYTVSMDTIIRLYKAVKQLSSTWKEYDHPCLILDSLRLFDNMNSDAYRQLDVPNYDGTYLSNSKINVYYLMDCLKALIDLGNGKDVRINRPEDSHNASIEFHSGDCHVMLMPVIY